MKNIIFLFIVSMLWQNNRAQSIRHIADINNKNTSIDSLKGAKLLIIVLPSQTDTAMSDQLLRFQKKYADKIKVIALVSVQPGNASKDMYVQSYAAATQAGVILSEGIASTEEAGDEQTVMIQWITNKRDNRQKDQFVTGSKYFISEDGRLYAQLGNETSLDDPLLNCIINTKVPVANVKDASTIKKSQ